MFEICLVGIHLCTLYLLWMEKKGKEYKSRILSCLDQVKLFTAEDVFLPTCPQKGSKTEQQFFAHLKAFICIQGNTA